MAWTDLPLCGGVSLKPEYFADAACEEGQVWFEAHPENYMIGGGPRLEGLLAAAAHHPISFHGVGASLGGPDLTPNDHISELLRLIELVNPASISEHAVWSRSEGRYFGELLPLPRTMEALQRLVDGVDHFQEQLGRTILLENPANYLSLVSEMDEPEFLVEVATRSGCGLLLDVNNVFVSANNCGINAESYVRAIPPRLVGEIHIAGHTPDPNFGNRLLIDSHDQPVSDAVWDLLQVALEHVGDVPVLIERDANLPPFPELMAERNQVNRMLASQHASRRAHA